MSLHSETEVPAVETKKFSLIREDDDYKAEKKKASIVTESNVDIEENKKGSLVSRFVLWFRRIKSSTLPVTNLREADYVKPDSVKLTSDLRGHWSLRIDFILSCIGFAVGLGNIWRFPFKVLKYGGGTFIVAYIIMLYVMAVPLFLLELLLAQFTNRGVTECWHFAPGLKGIGYVMLLMSLLCSIYYNLVIGWTIYYMFCSFKVPLPWSTCDNYWNDNMCIPSGFSDVQHVNSSMEMSSEQFWIRHVITRIHTINRNSYTVLTINDNPETIVWYTALCMSAAWIICALILMYGIKVSGKAMYALTTFPYVVITLMIILGSQLNGSGSGIRYYLRFNFREILNFEVWQAAAEQIFYSLGVGFGGMLTFGSYNHFHDNFQRDVLIISTINSATSIYAGFGVFQLLGFMAYRYGNPMSAMKKYSGDGLIFIAYPEVLSTFRGGNFLCILFFVMIFSLGMDSQVGMMETVITGVADAFPWLHGTKLRRLCFVWCIHILCNLCALIMVTKTGFYWFVILNYYSVATNLLMIGFTECVAVVYVYGIDNLNRDFRMMIGSQMSWYWRVCLLGPIPIITLFLTGYAIYSSAPTVIGHGYNTVVFPYWADVLGWTIFGLTLVPLLLFFIGYVVKQMRSGSTIVPAVTSALKPDLLWGPGLEENWHLNKYYSERLSTFINKPEFTFYKEE